MTEATAKTPTADLEMLTITDEAADRLKDEMDQHEGTQALRLLVQEGCCGFAYAMAMAKRDPEDGEIHVNSNGVDVYVDEWATDMIQGAEISWTEGVFGAGFAVDNPNEPDDGACGCR